MTGDEGMDEPNLAALNPWDRFFLTFSALSRDRDWTRLRTRGALFFGLILMGLVSGWLQGAYLLSGHQDPPMDFGVLACFSLVGLLVGLSLGASFAASRNLMARVSLSTLLGAALVTLVVHWCSPDVLNPGRMRADRDSLLGDPAAWGLTLGATTCGSLALSVHLLRRIVGRTRLTLLGVGITALLGARSQEYFWKEWDYRAYGHFGGCGMIWEAFATPGWIGVIPALCFGLGIQLLELATRLCEPGMIRTLLKSKVESRSNDA